MNKTSIRSIFIFIVFLWVTPVKSQGVTEIYLNNGRVAITTPVTAIAIKSEKDLGPSVTITFNSERINLPRDPDAPEFTYFISLDVPANKVTIESDLTDIRIFLINSGNPPKIQGGDQRQYQEECSYEFNAIPQSEWRAGLEAPSYSRSFTNVSHVVIHHSAGSNTNTNYTQVVRDIYLYHTDVNGWSDIGYNYLVAQDGSIYTGRDPDGGEQDNVLGAHFCGSNSTTMGICLLGNYETAQPTSVALSSVELITTFKLDKENLEPFASYPHAFGDLGSIIGHRDGCSTACPGENVYSMLSVIRSEVNKNLEDCDPIDPEPEMVLDFYFDKYKINIGQMVSFENRSSGYTSYAWYFEGGNPRFSTRYSDHEVRYFLPGSYDITLIGKNEMEKDTLTIEGAIEVVGAPVIYPNPISGLETLNIASTDEITSIHLVDMQGKIKQIESLDNQYSFPIVEPGIYILRVQTTERVFTRKLLVN